MATNEGSDEALSGSQDTPGTLNIFTCANQPYEDFGPIFAASCFWSNPGVTVELGVEDHDAFMQVHGRGINAIRDFIPKNALTIRNAQFRRPNGRKILPNSVRFLTTPEVVSDYVYISDIDIITLESNILGIHVRQMESTDLPFSNIVTKSTRFRMSGLHFTRYDALYPLPQHDDLLVKVRGDEALLYALVERKIGSIPPQEGKGFRPVHGIHVSPNRSPYFYTSPDGRARPGWLSDYSKRFQSRWNSFRNSHLFKSIEPLLSSRMTDVVSEIDNFDPRKLLFPQKHSGLAEL